jgi:hypothetical protein
MKTIQELSDSESVYALYRSLEAQVEDAQIDHPDDVRDIARAGLASAVGEGQAAELVSQFEDAANAGELARATLLTLRERPDFVVGVAADIDSYVADPPSEEKMDLGISLGLLALAGLAMALMGSLEVTGDTEVSGDARKSSWSVKFKGSDKVPELVNSILEALKPGP